jgi:hypothetical protein
MLVLYKHQLACLFRVHPTTSMSIHTGSTSTEETTGHCARAARISHHLRATSRARSASPAQIFPPTQVVVDVIAPKPMPSSEVITETHDATDNDDLFARGSGRMGTRTRSLSVVKLEEMTARAAAETEVRARAEKESCPQDASCSTGSIRKTIRL